MQKNKIFSIVLMLYLAFQMTHAAVYVDLESYKGRTCQKQKDGMVAEFFKSGWRSFKSSVNETVFSDNINSEQFWNTLRTSLEDGTFYNRVAGIQTLDNQTGSDIFLRTLYSSIEQVPVKYKSVSPDGDSIMLSGKIFLPKKKEAKHIIIANHFTICADREAPSGASSLEGIFATKDYIVLMPDYIGYGISDSLTHPYLHLESTVSSAIDLLKADMHYLRANCYTFYSTVILVGYSQGGAATLALQKKLEEEYAYEFPVYKVFAGAGPYDLVGTFDYYISDTKTDIPCSLPMLILGMDYGEHLGLKREDFFQPLLMEKCPRWIESKSKMMNEVNSELGTDMNLLLKPVIFKKEAYPTSVLYEAVKKNCIVNWTPKSRLFLFHSTQDNMVPFLNSEHLKANFDAQHLENVQYDFAPYGNHMNAAVTFFEKVYKSL